MADTVLYSNVQMQKKKLTLRYCDTNIGAFCKTFKIPSIFFLRMFLASILCVCARMYVYTKSIHCHKDKVKITNHQAHMKFILFLNCYTISTIQVIFLNFPNNTYLIFPPISFLRSKKAWQLCCFMITT